MVNLTHVYAKAPLLGGLRKNHSRFEMWDVLVIIIILATIITVL